MTLLETQKNLLQALAEHRKISHLPMEMAELYRRAFAADAVPLNVRDALQVLISRRYIDPVWSRSDVISASITSPGERYLELLLTDDN